MMSMGIRGHGRHYCTIIISVPWGNDVLWIQAATKWLQNINPPYQIDSQINGNLLWIRQYILHRQVILLNCVGWGFAVLIHIEIEHITTATAWNTGRVWFDFHELHNIIRTCCWWSHFSTSEFWCSCCCSWKPIPVSMFKLTNMANAKWICGRYFGAAPFHKSLLNFELVLFIRGLN